MSYVERLLGPDEELVLALHPHWRALVPAFLLVPVVVGAATYGVAAMPSGPAQGAARWAVVVVAVLLLLVWSLWPWLRWRGTWYVLTTRRVVVRWGVLRRGGRDLPLSRVNDVSFERTLVQRLVGSGTLRVESAGERGQLVLPDVPHVEAVHRRLDQLLAGPTVR